MRRHGFRYVMEALAALFMPDTCASCGRVLQEGDCRPLCVSCRMELSPTCWKGRADNPVELLFRGVYPIARAHAQFYYVHDTPNAQTVFLLNIMAVRKLQDSWPKRLLRNCSRWDFLTV